jgi:hypothetical protein
MKKLKKLTCLGIIILLLAGCSNQQKNVGKELEQSFRNPPDAALSWVLWDWINSNVTREGITKDLEAMKRVGVGGVVWRGLAGPWWAPEGEAEPYTKKWDDLMQWAIQEAERLGIEFDISIDHGYGSGGPHITPDISMQKLYWSQKTVEGGKQIVTKLAEPEIPMDNVKGAWLRPEEQLKEKVREDIRKIDSYRDIAVLAIPYSQERAAFTIPQLGLRTALGDKTHFLELKRLTAPETAAVSMDKIIDLTNEMEVDGTLRWESPPGKWQIIRFGHASNYKLTRPCPAGAVGLECNRMGPEGIEAHFDAFLKPIFEAAGTRTGKTLKYIFLDSWEAGSQNWTAGFQEEFRKRNGYDLRPWIPVLTGTIVASPEQTERFLWDFRQTVGEMIRDNYSLRLKELTSPYGIKFSTEAYGNLCIDKIQYAESSDFPIGEFWTNGDEKYPYFGSQGYYNSMKVMASAAHTGGNPFVGAEAFTGFRGWKDHPFIFKGMGDQAFCQGINRFILHLSAHQAYDRMKPGLTHRRWGGHFNRHNTWWEYSKPWFDYIARSQHMLQQGQFVADACYFFGEGAPLHVRDMDIDLPAGYDYDVCSSDIVLQMEVRDGGLVLPSEMTYRYLILPDNDRLTLPLAKKIEELAKAGAKIIAQQRFAGTPGLSGFPESDQKVKEIADRLWEQELVITDNNWEELFGRDGLSPDFEGEKLNYIHRKSGGVDFYFVANPDPKEVLAECSFRISGKIPELWDPETGETRELPEYEASGDQITVPLEFGPMQSWFVVFRRTKATEPAGSENFPLEYEPVKEIDGPWQVRFDPEWGGPAEMIAFDYLQDWSKHNEEGIRFYSGTAVYSNAFTLSESQLSAPLLLDLGSTEVMARVRVNGKECGIAWKLPYRVDISTAVREGVNTLEIDVVNTWVNRMIGDEYLPEDTEWINWEIMKEWPDWFLNNEPRPSGRYTFTSAKHYTKENPLLPSGLLGPVRIYKTFKNKVN